MREEDILANNILTTSGFLIRSYSINQGKVDIEKIKELRSKLAQLKAMEESIVKDLEKGKHVFTKLESEYNAVMARKINFSKILPGSIKDSLYFSGLAVVRCDEIISLIENKTDKTKFGGREIAKKIVSLQKMLNQVMKTVDALTQIENALNRFKKDSKYDTFKVYGRVMNNKEFKETTSKSSLCSLNNPTPVFDCPSSVEKRILSLNPDERKSFFAVIGVKGGLNIIIFVTNIKPLNADNPINMRNGLKEYKFPRGLPINILKAA